MTLLSCKQLHVRIGTKQICKNLQLDLHPGDRYALLGPNGSGKTTLLKTLAGLHPSSQGEIFLNDTRLAALPRKAIASQLGMLFQHSHYLFEQSVFQHCLQGRYAHIGPWQHETAADKQHCLTALRRMELEHLSQHCVSKLSGGEARRLAIATLLAQDPAVFLLDEPINHLDLRHQLQVLDYFSSLQHTGILMSLHDVRLAKQFCNKVILLFPDGELTLGDTSLLTEKNLARLYDLPQEWLPLIN